MFLLILFPWGKKFVIFLMPYRVRLSLFQINFLRWKNRKKSSLWIIEKNQENNYKRLWKKPRIIKDWALKNWKIYKLDSEYRSFFICSFFSKKNMKKMKHHQWIEKWNLSVFTLHIFKYKIYKKKSCLIQRRDHFPPWIYINTYINIRHHSFDQCCLPLNIIHKCISYGIIPSREVHIIKMAKWIQTHRKNQSRDRAQRIEVSKWKYSQSRALFLWRVGDWMMKFDELWFFFLNQHTYIIRPEKTFMSKEIFIWEEDLFSLTPSDSHIYEFKVQLFFLALQ